LPELASSTRNSLGFHLSYRPNRRHRRVSGVREKIEAAGAKLLYLPPYSPDLNPIEKA
jgi:transposase